MDDKHTGPRRVVRSTGSPSASATVSPSTTSTSTCRRVWSPGSSVRTAPARRPPWRCSSGSSVRPRGWHRPRRVDQRTRRVPRVGSAHWSKAQRCTRASPASRTSSVLATPERQQRRTIPALLDLVGLHGRGDDRFPTLLVRHEATARDRRGAPRRSGAARPRRADERARPAGHRARCATSSGRSPARIERCSCPRTILSELEQVCDWLVLIDTGRSVYQGPAADFLEDGAALAIAPQWIDGPRRPPAGGDRHRPARPAQRRTGDHPAARSRAIGPGRRGQRGGLRSRRRARRDRPVRDSLEERYLSLVAAPDAFEPTTANGASS